MTGHQQNRWEVPHGWEWRKLGEKRRGEKEIVEIVIGKDKATESRLVRNGGTIPFILSGDLKNEKEVSVSKWTTLKAVQEQKIDVKNILTGDRLLLALARKETVGRIGIYRDQAVQNHVTAAIIPDNGRIDVDYLFYCFRERTINAFVTEEVLKGVGTSIRKPRIQQIEIPLPPTLEEQHRIVERLEALLRDVQKGRDQLEQIRQDIDGVVEKALAEVFDESKTKTWKKYMLHAIVPTLPQQLVPPLPEYTDCTSITAKDIDLQWGLALDGLRTLINDRKPQYVLEDDKDYVLYGKSKTTKKRVAVLHHSKALCDTDIVPLSIDAGYQDNLLPDFLMWSLLARNQQTPPGNYRSYEVLFPLKNEQQRIVTYLDDIRQQTRLLLEKAQESIESITQIEQELLRKALRGELYRGKEI